MGKSPSSNRFTNVIRTQDIVDIFNAAEHLRKEFPKVVKPLDEIEGWKLPESQFIPYEDVSTANYKGGVVKLDSINDIKVEDLPLSPPVEGVAYRPLDKLGDGQTKLLISEEWLYGRASHICFVGGGPGHHAKEFFDKYAPARSVTYDPVNRPMYQTNWIKEYATPEMVTNTISDLWFKNRLIRMSYNADHLFVGLIIDIRRDKPLFNGALDVEKWESRIVEDGELVNDIVEAVHAEFPETIIIIKARPWYRSVHTNFPNINGLPLPQAYHADDSHEFRVVYGAEQFYDGAGTHGSFKGAVKTEKIRMALDRYNFERKRIGIRADEYIADMWKTLGLDVVDNDWYKEIPDNENVLALHSLSNSMND